MMCVIQGESRKVYFQYDFKEYSAIVNISVYRDDNWGADADGLRGVSRKFLDMFEIVSLEHQGDSLKLESLSVEEREGIESEVYERVFQQIQDEP